MNKTKPKKDIKFLAILVALLLLFSAGLLLVEKIDKEAKIDVSDLPDEATSLDCGKLIISEVVSNNGGICINEYNQAADFIELYNGTGSDVSLYGWGLSDKEDRVKWAFPEVTIKNGEYLVVFLTGKNENGLNANFKLSSSGGEKLILVNNKGKVEDALETVALSKNQALIRNGSDWTVVSFATPGFENSQKGIESYKASMLSSNQPKLVINEFLPKNNGNFTNEFGRCDGYIEIKNISTESVLLSDYFLSNELLVPYKFQLPGEYLAAGAVYYIYAGDSSYSQENYCGFAIPNKTGAISLSKQGNIESLVEYENVPNGCAYIRYEDGSYYYGSNLSMGYDNTSYGTDRFQYDNLKKASGLVINELMSENQSFLPQNGGRYYDFVELYNNSDKEIKLSEYCLSTDGNNLTLFTLPDVTLAPGGYYVLMCSGDTALTNASYVHTNFKLGSSVSLYLSKAGKIVDSVYAYDVPRNYSYARGEQYGWVYCESPTPKAKNNGGILIISPAPSIQKSAGVYYDAKSLTISISGQGNIYYTTDGSVPSIYSKKYVEPIQIRESTTLRVASIIDGAMISDCVSASYILDDNTDFAIASITMDPNEYADLYYNWGSGKTFQAYFELYEKDGSCASPCGIHLSGFSARMFTTKNYTLKFDSEYGASSLNYKLFDDLDCSRFDAITLRGGSNAEDTLPWKDEFATALAKGVLEVRDYKTCILYINGEYKGVFNIREKINAEMLSDHYNVLKEDFSITRWSCQGGYNFEYGKVNTWMEVEEWGATHDLSSSANYEYFCSICNVQSLCDLWIYEWYMNNPDIYNIRVFSHPDVDGGRCNFIYFDLDMGFWGPYNNYLSEVIFSANDLAPDISGHAYLVRINNSLLQNSEFKELFLQRLAYLLNNELKTSNALEVFDGFTSEYKNYIGRSFSAYGFNIERYYSSLNYARSNVQNRSTSMLIQTQEFFGFSNAQMRSYFGDLWLY